MSRQKPQTKTVFIGSYEEICVSVAIPKALLKRRAVAFLRIGFIALAAQFLVLERASEKCRLQCAVAPMAGINEDVSTALNESVVSDVWAVQLRDHSAPGLRGIDVAFAQKCEWKGFAEGRNGQFVRVEKANHPSFKIELDAIMPKEVHAENSLSR